MAEEATGEARLASVVMPVYNVADYVAEAVDSVLAQDWPNVELVVVDDGSTDDTAARVAAMAPRWDRPGRRLRVVSKPNGGSATARNRGMEEMSGEIVGFCDSDDRWRPGLLSRAIAALDAEPGLDLVFPRYAYIDAEGREYGAPSGTPQPRYDADALLAALPIHTATGLVARAEAARRIGPFDQTVAPCEDIDWELRFALDRPSSVGGLDEVLVDYRKRPGQLTGDWQRMAAAWGRMMAKRRTRTPPPAASAAALGHARQAVFWSALAYHEGDHRASRRLIAQAFRTAPMATGRDGHAWIRAGAAAATLLPGGAHRALGAAVNGLQARLRRRDAG